MRYPEHLPEGGTIGFVAPSFGCAMEPYQTCFENACRTFEKLGYRLALGPNCRASEGIGISNTPEKCAAELMEYYRKEVNDVLISCGGGELMCEVLSHMDFEALKAAKPKWYMGFSDNTNMTFLLATICDTASIYGPCASSFGMEPWHESLQDAFDLLTGKKNAVHGYDRWEPAEAKESLRAEETPLAPYRLTEKKILRSYVGHSAVPAEKKLQFEGRLIGGCMDCLVNLLGTRFDRTAEFTERYKGEGLIWFLEACDLNVFSIRRAMWQMEEAGWFRYVKGFLIGRPLCFGQELMGLDAYQAVLKVAGEKNVPVIMDVDLGHLSPMMPLITGSHGKVSVCGNDISIQFS